MHTYILHNAIQKNNKKIYFWFARFARFARFDIFFLVSSSKTWKSGVGHFQFLLLLTLVTWLQLFTDRTSTRRTSRCIPTHVTRVVVIVVLTPILINIFLPSFRQHRLASYMIIITSLQQ